MNLSSILGNISIKGRATESVTWSTVALNNSDVARQFRQVEPWSFVLLVVIFAFALEDRNMLSFHTAYMRLIYNSKIGPIIKIALKSCWKGALKKAIERNRTSSRVLFRIQQQSETLFYFHTFFARVPWESKSVWKRRSRNQFSSFSESEMGSISLWLLQVARICTGYESFAWW